MSGEPAAVALHPTVGPYVRSHDGRTFLCIPLAPAPDAAVPAIVEIALAPWRAVRLAQDLLHGALGAEAKAAHASFSDRG